MARVTVEERRARTGTQDWPWEFILPLPDCGGEMDTGVGCFVYVPYSVALAMGTCWTRSDMPPEDFTWSI